MRGGMGMRAWDGEENNAARGLSLFRRSPPSLVFTFRSSPSALSSSMKGAVKASELRVR